MEKLLKAYMANPNKENLAKVFAYDRKHIMAVCALPVVLQTVFNQLRREHA